MISQAAEQEILAERYDLVTESTRLAASGRRIAVSRFVSAAALASPADPDKEAAWERN
jgi:hypothetical protein